MRAGEESRISHLKESVKEKDSKLVDLVADLGYFWMLRVFIQHVGDPMNVGAEVVTRMIHRKKSLGVITKAAPDPLPRGVFPLTLSLALPAILKWLTSSDEARRDFIKGLAATVRRHLDFRATASGGLEVHQ